MKRLSLAVGAGLLLGLLPGSTLAAVGVLDQSNTTTGISLSSDVDLFAQSFTAGKSGSLTRVDLYMNGDGASPITVSIQATSGGVPNGTVLATSGPGTASTSSDWVQFPFSSPATVTSGVTYAIMFGTGANNFVFGSGEAYAGGQALHFDGSVYQPILDLHLPRDFTFRTYVAAAPTRTPPPTGTAAVPSSNRPAPTIWLVVVVLTTLFGGLVALAARERRRKF
jgi:hypothetical protein